MNRFKAILLEFYYCMILGSRPWLELYFSYFPILTVCCACVLIRGGLFPLHTVGGCWAVPGTGTIGGLMIDQAITSVVAQI